MSRPLGHRFRAFARVALLPLVAAGCAFFGGAPDVVAPPGELYASGERELEDRRYDLARAHFRRLLERHPGSALAPRARFLVGEAWYREGEFDKAVAEFETFFAFSPVHEIADLVQYRRAMAFFDRLRPVEQDQSLTRKALEQFEALVRDFPDSRYAADALARIDLCRERLVQKEVWAGGWNLKRNQLAAARRRLEAVLRDHPLSSVVPEVLWHLADIAEREGDREEAGGLRARLLREHPTSDFARRARERLTAGG